MPGCLTLNCPSKEGRKSVEVYKVQYHGTSLKFGSLVPACQHGITKQDSWNNGHRTECGLKVLLQRPVVQSTFGLHMGRVKPTKYIHQSISYLRNYKVNGLELWYDKLLVVWLKSLRNANSHSNADRLAVCLPRCQRLVSIYEGLWKGLLPVSGEAKFHRDWKFASIFLCDITS